MDEPVTLPTDRKFGFVFVVVFLLAAFSLYRHGHSLYWLFIGLAALTLLIALVKPGLLRPANKAWMALGLLLSKIVTPVVLAVLFFVIFSPIGLIMKAFGRDAMRRKISAATSSYWIVRDPPGPDGASLREQG